MILTREYLNNWLNDLKIAWLNKNVEVAVRYFINIKEYYETPFDAPVKALKELRTLWEEIKEQDIECLNFDIICIEELTAVVHWYLKYSIINQKNFVELDGIYVMKFDEALNCIEFRQWWVEK